MVVRMHRRACAALAAEQLVARLASTSFMFMLVCVPEPVCHTDERKLRVVPAGEHLVGGGGDRLAVSRVERAERDIDDGGGALDLGEGVDQRHRHALAADAEILP